MTNAKKEKVGIGGGEESILYLQYIAFDIKV